MKYAGRYEMASPPMAEGARPLGEEGPGQQDGELHRGRHPQPRHDTRQAVLGLSRVGRVMQTPRLVSQLRTI